MGQFIPNVSEEDVERILNREFPAENHAEIKKIIANIDVREKARVIIACFKNANKDYSKLINELTNAEGYWREIISAAEYPKIKKARRLTEDEINEKMKEQYLKWFNEK